MEFEVFLTLVRKYKRGLIIVSERKSVIKKQKYLLTFLRQCGILNQNVGYYRLLVCQSGRKERF